MPCTLRLVLASCLLLHGWRVGGNSPAITITPSKSPASTGTLWTSSGFIFTRFSISSTDPHELSANISKNLHPYLGCAAAAAAAHLDSRSIRSWSVERHRRID